MATDTVRAMDGIFIRGNQGYDFAAWAHILLLHPELFDAKILYLLNDSLIGPTNDATFGDLLSELRNSEADVIGLTENFERVWHLQSYFLAFKSRALTSVALHTFINNIVSYTDKEDVVKEFEIRLAPILKTAGLNCKPMFSATDFRNPTIYSWKQLLESVFPFLKVMTIRDSFEGVDVSDWREIVAGQGYDVSLAERTLAAEKAPLGAQELLAPMGRQLLVSPALSTAISGHAKVAFIGPWNYNNGLAVASRGYISALRHAGLQVNFHPIRRPFHVHQLVAPPVDICDFSGPADVVIVHLNPDAWPGLLTETDLAIIRRAKVSVGLWVWEMVHIPENWYPTFDEVDAICTPSRYCADVFAAKAQVPVEVIPHVVTVDRSTADPVRAVALRRELGVSQNDRIILYAFDGSSYLVRKNPFALLRSFARSRLAERGWRVVLKTKHLYDSPVQGSLLQQEVDRTNGVVLIDRSVDKETMGELLRAADIFASPHCSEGFGLTIAEAMAMSKLVVATDYGGSRDFLDAECGFPVRYRLQSLDRDYGHYTRGGGVWAQVDEAHLAELLVEASELVEAGDTHLGEAARHRINDLFSPAAVGTKISRIIFRLLSNG
jgi:glycosyltransferase involved in cell wall biosynthesis